MRIAINAASLRSGGGARYISDFIRTLSSMSLCDDFRIFVPSDALPSTVNSSLSIHLEPINKKSWLMRLWWEQVTLRRILKTEKMDVLFSSANFGMLFCPIAQILLVQTAIYSSAQYLSLAATYSLVDRISFWFRKCLFWLSIWSADIVMVPSREVLSHIKHSLLRRSDHRFIVNPYGVRKSRAQNAQVPDNGKVMRLLFVSMYYEHKNLGTLLKCMRLLNRQRCDLRFILTTTVNPKGSRGRQSAVRSEDVKLCDDPHVRRWTKFVQPVTQEEADALYTDADMCVFPSIVESFGFPLVEAMVSGLPIVASDTIVNREMCQDAALYFRCFDPEDLADKLRRVTSDPSLWQQLSAAGLRRASEFDWVKHIGAVLNAAEKLYTKAEKPISSEHTFIDKALYRVYQNLPVWGQNCATSVYGRIISNKRFGRGYRSNLIKVLTRNSWSHDQIIQFQTQRVGELLQHSIANTLYYRRIAQRYGFEAADFHSAADLPKLPLLTRRDVLNHARDLVSSDVGHRKTVRLSTSGSTGVQLRLLLDRVAQQEQWAVWWRYRMIHGLRRTAWCGCFAGRVIVPAYKMKPPFWRVNYPARQILYSAYHMSAEVLHHYVLDIRQRKLEWLHGYPSVLTVLARYLVQRGLVLKMKWVTVGAESLSASQKALIETAFACRCYQHYGCVEGVANFSECAAGRLHADEDICAIELIPTGDSERFMIVGTNLLNFAMPLIRYDTGDLCTRPVASCQCGREGLCIERITGRSNDVILLKDGRPVGTLDEAFEFVPNLYEAQIVQSKPGYARISLVTAPRWSQSDEHVLLKEFHRRIGSLLEIDIQYTNSLERTRTGKVRMIVSDVVQSQISTR